MLLAWELTGRLHARRMVVASSSAFSGSLRDNGRQLVAGEYK